MAGISCNGIVKLVLHHLGCLFAARVVKYSALEIEVKEKCRHGTSSDLSDTNKHLCYVYGCDIVRLFRSVSISYPPIALCD